MLYIVTRRPVKTVLADKPTDFTYFGRSVRVLFVKYADSELFNINVDTCENNPAQSYTQKIMKQVPVHSAFIVLVE